MTTKALPAKVKAVPAEDTEAPEGSFEALVATYEKDSVGDRIVPGAFRKTLAEWSKRAKAGERMPVVWSHDHGDPFSHIGEVLEASETDEGLQVKGVLDLDNPTARQVYRLIKGGRIRNWSFAYDVRNTPAVDEEDGANLLKDLGVYEVGPTLIGANQATRTMAVKAAPQTKAGRVLSSKNEIELKAAVESMAGAIERLKNVLAQVTAPDSEETEDPGQDTPAETDAQPESPAKADESAETKAHEPSPTGPDLDLLAAELSLKLKGI